MLCKGRRESQNGLKPAWVLRFPFYFVESTNKNTNKKKSVPLVACLEHGRSLCTRHSPQPAGLRSHTLAHACIRLAFAKSRGYRGYRGHTPYPCGLRRNPDAKSRGYRGYTSASTASCAASLAAAGLLPAIHCLPGAGDACVVFRSMAYVGHQRQQHCATTGFDRLSLALEP